MRRIGKRRANLETSKRERARTRKMQRICRNMSVLQIRATDRIFIKLRWVFLPFCIWYCYLWVQNEILSLSCGNCLPRCIQIELNWTDDGIMLFLMHFRYDDGDEDDEDDEVIVAEVSSFASQSNKVIGRINSKHCSQNCKVILRKIIRCLHLRGFSLLLLVYSGVFFVLL